MCQNPLDVRVAFLSVLPQVVQVELVGAAMKAREMQRDPQSQFIGEFQLLVQQEFMNPALGEFASHGEYPIRLKPDHSPLANISLDVFESA